MGGYPTAWRGLCSDTDGRAGFLCLDERGLRREQAAIPRAHREVDAVASGNRLRCVGVRAQQHASHVDAAVLRVAQEDECLHRALDDVVCRLALSGDEDVRGADSDRCLVAHAQRFDRVASERPLRGLDVHHVPLLGGDRSFQEVGGADELRREPRVRVVVDVLGSTELDDLAIAHHRNLVGECQRFELVVRDEQRGDLQALREHLEFDAHVVTELGVEVRERLVEQQRLRLTDERTRKGETLLLAAGQLRSRTALQAIEAHQSERLHHAILHLSFGQFALALCERERNIIEHVHVRPDSVGLEHHADGALVRRDVSAPR